MARVKVIVLDDNGQAINEHLYELRDNLTQLNDMEAVIETLRPRMLGDMTHDLLSTAQSNTEKKKIVADIAKYI